jgi:hypothetical protein
MTKSDMLWRFENVRLRSTLFPFLGRSEYNEFEIDILHVCELHHLHTCDFLEFFETQKYDFLFKKQDHWCPCAPNLCLMKVVYIVFV